MSSWPSFWRIRNWEASRTTSPGAHTGAGLSLADDLTVRVLGVIWIHVSLSPPPVAHWGAHLGVSFGCKDVGLGWAPLRFEMYHSAGAGAVARVGKLTSAGSSRRSSGGKSRRSQG